MTYSENDIAKVFDHEWCGITYYVPSRTTYPPFYFFCHFISLQSRATNMHVANIKYEIGTIDVASLPFASNCDWCIMAISIEILNRQIGKR